MMMMMMMMTMMMMMLTMVILYAKQGPAYCVEDAGYGSAESVAVTVKTLQFQGKHLYAGDEAGSVSCTLMKMSFMSMMIMSFMSMMIMSVMSMIIM